MKKLLLTTLAAGALAFGANAQDFDRWSIEVNGGLNKPMAPISGGAFLSPSIQLGHVDFGVRYMFNEKFGAKLDYGFGSNREARGADSQSPGWDTNYSRLNLQGVVNLARVLEFESFTNSLGLLLHAGGGYGTVKPQENAIAGFKDQVYQMIFGLTPQLKLTDNIALVGDVSVILNGRQTVTWDGDTMLSADLSNGFYGTNGTWWTGTLGLNFYLGGNDQHADWHISSSDYVTKEELDSQINGIKDMLKDSDGDGVPDYLDKEPNTPNGARVDAAGSTVDSDGDGTPDHLDDCPFQPGPASSNGCPVVESKDEVDYFKKAINDGYVNVYYAFDSSKPLSYSVSAVNYVANFLKRNPGVNVEVKGYADELGSDNYNMKLSEKRAKTVHDLLVAAGVDASRVSFKGYGEDTSVDKSSADARQLARRASFEVK